MRVSQEDENQECVSSRCLAFLFLSFVNRGEAVHP